MKLKKNQEKKIARKTQEFPPAKINFYGFENTVFSLSKSTFLEKMFIFYSKIHNFIHKSMFFFIHDFSLQKHVFGERKLEFYFTCFKREKKIKKFNQIKI